MGLKREHGFTLLEVLVVVVIIGILISIAVISFSNIIDRAKTDVCLANRRVIKTARIYNHSKNGSYGNSEDDLLDVFQLMGFNASTIGSLKCPSGGTYNYEANTSEVTCSIGGHNQ